MQLTSTFVFLALFAVRIVSAAPLYGATQLDARGLDLPDLQTRDFAQVAFHAARGLEYEELDARGPTSTGSGVSGTPKTPTTPTPGAPVHPAAHLSTTSPLTASAVSSKTPPSSLTPGGSTASHPHDPSHALYPHQRDTLPGTHGLGTHGLSTHGLPTHGHQVDPLTGLPHPHNGLHSQELRLLAHEHAQDRALRHEAHEIHALERERAALKQQLHAAKLSSALASHLTPEELKAKKKQDQAHAKQLKKEERKKKEDEKKQKKKDEKERKAKEKQEKKEKKALEKKQAEEARHKKAQDKKDKKEKDKKEKEEKAKADKQKAAEAKWKHDHPHLPFPSSSSPSAGSALASSKTLSQTSLPGSIPSTPSLSRSSTVSPSSSSSSSPSTPPSKSPSTSSPSTSSSSPSTSSSSPSTEPDRHSGYGFPYGHRHHRFEMHKGFGYGNPFGHDSFAQGRYERALERDREFRHELHRERRLSQDSGYGGSYGY